MEWEIGRITPEESLKHFEAKMKFTLGPMEVKYYQDEKIPMCIIDVRSKDAYDEGHVPGAINLPEDQWESLAGLSKDKPNVVYCYSVVCHLAAKAAVYFASRGFSVIEMDGGFEYWKHYELAVETSGTKAA